MDYLRLETRVECTSAAREIEADIRAIEADIVRMLAEVTGTAGPAA